MVIDLDGYRLGLTARTAFDFTLSPLFARALGEGFDVTISRETATYNGLGDVIGFALSTFLPFLFQNNSVREHVEHYEYRFLLSQEWQANNRVAVERWTDASGVEFISAVIQEPGDAVYDGYLYATVYTPSREYLRILCRYKSGEAALRHELCQALSQVRGLDPTGEGV